MINSWFYQLQNIDPVQVGKIKADVKVVDFSRDGTDKGAFTFNEVQIMRGGNPWSSEFVKTAPRVLSYISIGEAESYRGYFDRRWTSSGVDAYGAPNWFGPGNPDWPGNYKVKFWDPEWKFIIRAYLDKIIDAGFDGVYLDIIDAYEFWEDQGVDNAADLMIDFVRSISYYCHGKNLGFWIVPQNGDGLLKNRSYREAISAIAKEDLLYGIDGDGKPNSPEAVAEAKANLDHMVASAKPVLVVEYVKKKAQIADTLLRCKNWGYVPLITARDLDVVA